MLKSTPTAHRAGISSRSGERGCQSGRIRKRTAFPRPGRDHGPMRTVRTGATKASARPGGCEAPAMGGTGAGRGLWPPAGVWHAHRMAGAMAPARPRGGPLEGESSFPVSSPCGWHIFSPPVFSPPRLQSPRQARIIPPPCLDGFGLREIHPRWPTRRAGAVGLRASGTPGPAFSGPLGAPNAPLARWAYLPQGGCCAFTVSAQTIKAPPCYPLIRLLLQTSPQHRHALAKHPVFPPTHPPEVSRC